MIMEMARRLNGARKVQIGTSEGETKRLAEAATVIEHAPDLAADVAAGTEPRAYAGSCLVAARQPGPGVAPPLGQGRP
jgi:hypothetical protein